MKKTLLITLSLIAVIILLFIIVTKAEATAISFDGNFGSQIIQPFASFSGATLKINNIIATSTTATSTFAGPVGIGTTTPIVQSSWNPGLIMGLNKNIILYTNRTTNNFVGNIIFKNETASTTKSGLEWYGFENPTLARAWIVFHESLNGEAPYITHGAPHIEIETSDAATGAKQGRFSIQSDCDYDCVTSFNQTEVQITRNSGQTNGNLLFNGAGQIRNTGVMQIVPNNAINTKAFRVATSTDNDIAIDVTSGTELEVLDTLNITGNNYISGNLGVGTTSPLRQLTVEASGSAGTTNGPMFAFRQNQTAINSTSNSNLGEIYFTGADIASGEEGLGAKIRAQASSFWNGITGDYPTDLLFFTSPDGGSGGLQERLRITSAGNLGVGTTTPGSILSVGGVANLTTATSTFSSTGGINLRSGCFSINDVCILQNFFSTAGRSLTGSGNTIDADAELYTHSSTYNYASSTLALSTYPVLAKKFPQAATISTISCQNIGVGTSTIMFEERTSLNTAGTDVLYSAGLSAGGDLELASSTLSNNSMASGSWLVMLIDAVTGTPSNPVCDVKYTYND